MSTDELLDEMNIELILNLAVPAAHAEISKKTLLKGKNVYSEKPLAVNVEDARELVRLSKQRGLYIGYTVKL